MADIDKQLEAARKRAGTYGQLYGAKETADDYLKTCYAMLYEGVPDECKSVADRDAWVKRQPQYEDAIERKRDAYAAWKTAETYMKILLAEVEVWRTQCANDRTMDRAHQ